MNMSWSRSGVPLITYIYEEVISLAGLTLDILRSATITDNGRDIARVMTDSIRVVLRPSIIDGSSSIIVSIFPPVQMAFSSLRTICLLSHRKFRLFSFLQGLRLSSQEVLHLIFLRLCRILLLQSYLQAPCSFQRL